MFYHRQYIWHLQVNYLLSTDEALILSARTTSLEVRLSTKSRKWVLYYTIPCHAFFFVLSHQILCHFMSFQCLSIAKSCFKFYDCIGSEFSAVFSFGCAKSHPDFLFFVIVEKWMEMCSHTPSSSSIISRPMAANVVHLQLLLALAAHRLCALNLHTTNSKSMPYSIKC